MTDVTINNNNESALLFKVFVWVHLVTVFKHMLCAFLLVMFKIHNLVFCTVYKSFHYYCFSIKFYVI